MSRTTSTSLLPTPCPVGQQPRRASLFLSQQDDTTTNIEYTRALDSSLHASKPRRRSSILPGQQPARKAAQQVTIFEDIEEDLELSVKNAPSKIQGSTLLCKPARRVAPSGEKRRSVPQQTNAPFTSGTESARAGLKEIGQGPARAPVATQSKEIGGARARRVSGLHGISQSRSRASLAPSEEHGGQVRLPPAEHPLRCGSAALPASTMKGSIKEAAKRRITIYAPDDTTVMTLHPQGNYGHTINDTFYMPNAPSAVVANEFNEGHKYNEEQSHLRKPIRRPRKSLMAAPKRLPFQHVDNFGNTESFDVCGDNTGKENVPPENYEKFKSAVTNSPEARQLRNTTTLCQPTAASRARQSILPRDAVLVRSNPRPVSLTPSPKANKRNTPPKAIVDGSDRARANSRLREAVAQKRSHLDVTKLKQYPVLTENFTQLSLFENDWLSNQEVAITEIINEIFKSTPSHQACWKIVKSVRSSLFELYDVPEVAMLHSRLQASLLYGALSAPSSLSSKIKLDDIGLRRRFMTLLLDTYDEGALSSAVEIVVGRQILTEPSNPATSLDGKASRRDLVAFIETFFVRVSDIDTTDALHNHGANLDLARWRKTMLRTFMLVWLLDHGKTAGIFARNLFKTKSTHKSSSSVLKALASLLLHSVGDILRSLKQLNYEVQHVQDPLDEVNYHIENLAVDLRDGVLLSRLVEILLHCRPATGIGQSYDETITIVLPDATELISHVFDADLGRSQNVLTQHLKLPCISETQKIFNVEVALSALQRQGVHGQNAVGDIIARDIVHGHREKTMSFLWQLVSTFGLRFLVDCKVLAEDIERVSEQPQSTQSREPQHMLLDWAAAHCGGKTITNLSTDFVDGKAYVEILNGFACWLPSLKYDGYTPSTRQILEHQLQILGCSEAFKKQLTSAIGVTVPSQETTTSNLAFLASRLLPIMQQHEAARKIQKFWRARNCLRIATVRVAKIKVGRECAAFAHARNREIEAVIVVQRAWRGVVARRLEQWQHDVAAFQLVARGFLARKALKQTERKVVGGW